MGLFACLFVCFCFGVFFKPEFGHSPLPDAGRRKDVSWRMKGRKDLCVLWRWLHLSQFCRLFVFLTTGIVGILLPESIIVWVMKQEKAFKLLKERMCVFMLSLNAQFRISLSQTSWWRQKAQIWGSHKLNRKQGFHKHVFRCCVYFYVYHYQPCNRSLCYFELGLMWKWICKWTFHISWEDNLQ